MSNTYIVFYVLLIITTILIDIVKTHYWRHKVRLDAPSLVYDARDNGYQISEKTVIRVLQGLGLRSKAARKFKYKTDTGKSS